jgi:hypothetical protein
MPIQTSRQMRTPHSPLAIIAGEAKQWCSKESVDCFVGPVI